MYNYVLYFIKFFIALLSYNQAFNFANDVYHVENIEELISNSLNQWRNGINDESIELLMNKPNSCNDFQILIITNGELSSLNHVKCKIKKVNKFRNHVINHFKRLIRTCKFNNKNSNFQIVINIRDEPMQLKSYLSDYEVKFKKLEAPLFSFQTTQHHSDIPIDYSVDHSDKKLERFISNVNYNISSGMQVPWVSKLPILFWRGSQTGGWYSKTNWMEFPRSKLVLYSKKHPNYIDAGFTHWTQVYPKAIKLINKEVGLKPYIDMYDQGKWKYLASMDGNGWANRLPFLLSLGSLVFKQESEYFTWWYSFLIPYKHFIPIIVNKTYDNILESIEWAISHDSEAFEIAQNGKMLVESLLFNLSDTYMCLLIDKYASLYNAHI